MLANYLHINQLDDTTFFNEYGKYLIDFQNAIFDFSNEGQDGLENNETFDKTELILNEIKNEIRILENRDLENENQYI
jgi:hypothetical protein